MIPLFTVETKSGRQVSTIVIVLLMFTGCCFQLISPNIYEWCNNCFSNKIQLRDVSLKNHVTVCKRTYRERSERKDDDTSPAKLSGAPGN